MKPLGKKFSPRAEFRLLRCFSVTIFPLAAPRSAGNNKTPRNPHKRGSCFPDSCYNSFSGATVDPNPDCLYLLLTLLGRSKDKP